MLGIDPDRRRQAVTPARSGVLGDTEPRSRTGYTASRDVPRCSPSEATKAQASGVVPIRHAGGTWEQVPGQGDNARDTSWRPRRSSAPGHQGALGSGRVGGQPSGWTTRRIRVAISCNWRTWVLASGSKTPRRTSATWPGAVAPTLSQPASVRTA